MDSSSVDEVIKIMKISPFYPLAKKSIIDLIIVNGSFRVRVNEHFYRRVMEIGANGGGNESLRIALAESMDPFFDGRNEEEYLVILEDLVKSKMLHLSNQKNQSK
jgi:hypothetical protein